MKILAAVVLACAIGATAAFTTLPGETPPILTNWVVGKGAGQVCQSFTSGTPVDFNAAYQFNGNIDNESGFKIKDVTFWVEDNSGNRIGLPNNGGSPIDALKMNTTGSNWSSATVAASANNAVTFNLSTSQDIPTNDERGYRLAVDSFTLPTKWKICSVYSNEHASTGSSIHYNIIGLAKVDSSNASTILSGFAPQNRDAVAFLFENGGTSGVVEQINVAMSSNQTGLQITSVDPTDLAEDTLSGASVDIATGGKSFSITGLEIEPGGEIKVWIKLNEAYTETTTFTVTGVFE